MHFQRTMFCNWKGTVRSSSCAKKQGLSQSGSTAWETSSQIQTTFWKWVVSNRSLKNLSAKMSTLVHTILTRGYACLFQGSSTWSVIWTPVNWSGKISPRTRKTKRLQFQKTTNCLRSISPSTSCQKISTQTNNYHQECHCSSHMICLRLWWVNQFDLLLYINNSTHYFFLFSLWIGPMRTSTRQKCGISNLPRISESWLGCNRLLLHTPFCAFLMIFAILSMICCPNSH